jgi:hypothetical protein
MTSPNGKMDQRRKSESLSKNLQSPQGTEDFGFKLSRRKSDGYLYFEKNSIKFLGVTIRLRKS